MQVNIADAAVAAAKADLVAATAATRAAVGKARSLRFNLQHTIELVDNQVAILRANVATLESQKASLTLAQATYDRDAKLVGRMPSRRRNSIRPVRRWGSARPRSSRPWKAFTRFGFRSDCRPSRPTART